MHLETSPSSSDWLPCPIALNFALCCVRRYHFLLLCAIPREDKLYRVYQTSVCNKHKTLREVMWVQARFMARSIESMLEYFIFGMVTLENK